MKEVKRPSLREAARRGAKQAAASKPAPPPVVAAPQLAKPAEAVTTTEPTPAKQTRREKPRPRLGRLPHGATFHLRYDAEAVKWSGTLTIVAPGSGIFKESVVSADDGAVFALLQRLDRKFRGMDEEPAATETAAAEVSDAV